MTHQPIEPIVLGHNSFFGVDHLSKERGAARAAKFEQTAAILEMVHCAVDQNVGGMMMSTHPRANLVAEAVRGEPELRDKLTFYPLLPYIAKYVRQANEKGVVNVVLDQLKGVGLGQKLAIFARGGLGVVRKDINDMLRTLIAVEMAPLKGLQLGAVFLHDVLTDLALSLEMKTIFELYSEEIEKQFKTRPAFATKNLPLFVRRFQEWGLPTPLVLTHVNKIGFSMNPSREACEECLQNNDVQVMAMSSLASGYLKPDEAYEYLFSLPQVDSVTVGVSTPDHAAETFAAIRKYQGTELAQPIRAAA